MSLGLCLCQGAGQRVPTMCSGVGCEWVMPALSSVAACHALFKTTGKQLSHFAILPTVLFNPTCMSCAAGAHRHATPRVPAAGWGCHRCSTGSPRSTEPTPAALALSWGCAGSGHAHSPQRGRTQRMSSCPVKLQAGAGSCDAVLGSKAKTQAGSHA